MSGSPPQKRMKMSETYLKSKLPNISGPIVGIYVGGNAEGENGEELYIHRNVLCQTSQYLRDKLLRPNNEEPPSNFSDVDASVFKAYGQYLYANYIDVQDDGPSTFNHLAKAYVLGERLADPFFQNKVINAMMTYCTRTGLVPSASSVNIIYDGTSKGSPARQLMANMWTDLKREKFRNLSSQMSKEFVDDLLQAFVDKKNTKDSLRNWKNNREPYYVKTERGTPIKR